MINGSAPRILITGNRGFTGKHVTKIFEQAGFTCTGLTRRHTCGEDPIDLADIQNIRACLEEVRPTHILHLAAKALVTYQDPMEFYRVNLFGTLNLLQAVDDLALAPESIVLASSANIYGMHPICPIREEQPPEPANHYAMSKLAMEHMARIWGDRLPIVIARPFNYTGPGQSDSFLIPKLIRHFHYRNPSIRLGNVDVVREFNDVRFVAHAYRILLESAIPGSVYNICSGHGYSIQQVLDTLGHITGHQIKVEADSDLMRANELKILIGDNLRLTELAGPLPAFTLEDTLRSMLST